jgi:hypothetical protein
MKRGHAMTTLPATGPVTSPPRPPADLRMTPGRWATLAIGVPIALVLIGWSAFSLVASIGQASFPVSATIPVQNGRLVASTGGGDITVHQGQTSGGIARLTGKVEYSLVRPSFTVSGSGISLQCHLPTGNCGLNATLDVPADTPVDLATGGGNVQASGIQRDVTMDTAGGDVTISGTGGSTDLSTGGGNVNASDLGGTTTFTTAGGDVTVNDLYSPHVKLDTGGGNVTLTFTRAPASLDITSGGGDITVVLPHSAGTQYDVNYQTEGGDYSHSVPVNPAAKDHTITVDSGGGNVNISAAS